LEAVHAEMSALGLFLRPGMKCRVLLGLRRGQITPQGFRTESIEEGRRIGYAPVTVMDVCESGCHASVILQGEGWIPFDVETSDLKPLGEA